jgi:hypothetical protein
MLFILVVSKHLGFACLECQHKVMTENSGRSLTAQVCVRFVVHTVALGQILTITTAALPVSFDLRSILIL